MEVRVLWQESRLKKWGRAEGGTVVYGGKEKEIYQLSEAAIDKTMIDNIMFI